MDGFVRTHLAVDGSEAGPATMAYYEREDIPFYYALAEAFTICDNYYCSVLGPTHPNRLYSMSASIDPEGLNGGPLVETLSSTFFEFRGALHVGDDARTAIGGGCELEGLHGLGPWNL